MLWEKRAIQFWRVPDCVHPWKGTASTGPREEVSQRSPIVPPTRANLACDTPLAEVGSSITCNEWRTYSEVGETVLGRCSMYALSVPSSSQQPKEQATSLQCVILGENLVISVTCEVGFAGSISRRTNCEKAWDAASRFLSTTLAP